MTFEDWQSGGGVFDPVEFAKSTSRPLFPRLSSSSCHPCSRPAWLHIQVVDWVLSLLQILFHSLLVIRGARRSAPRLLLPWLVIQVLVILSCLAGGLYLVIAFTLISKERDLSRACAGLGPIGLAVLLILLWLPVDQLYIRLKRSSALVIELTPGLRRSQSKLSCSTLASARSLSTIGGKKQQQRGAMLKSRSRTSVVSSRLLNKDLMAERSRSLELILSSQGSSSPTPPGSLLFPVVHPGTQTLPRLRPCREAPGVKSHLLSSSR